MGKSKVRPIKNLPGEGLISSPGIKKVEVKGSGQFTVDRLKVQKGGHCDICTCTVPIT